MQAHVGFIDSPTSTGVQTYTVSGLATTPKMVWLFGANHGTSGADQDDHHKFFGAAISSTKQHAWGVEPLHGIAASVANQCVVAHSQSHCVYVPDAGGTRILDATFSAFGVGTFALNWTDIWTSPIRLFYVVFSGDQLEVDLGSNQARTSLGLQQITAPWRPDLVMCHTGIGIGLMPVTQANHSSSGCLGFATSVAQQVSAWRANSGIAATHRATTLQKTDKILTYPAAPAGATPFREAAFTQMLNDGFELNWTTVNATAAYFFWIAFKGYSYKLVSFTATPGAGNNQVIGGTLGFTPAFTFLHSANKAAAAGATAHFRTSWGAVDSGGNKWSIWGGDRDDVGTTIAATRADTTRVFRIGAENNTGPSVDTHAAIDTVTFGADNVTAHYDVTTSVGQEVFALVAGSVAASGSGSRKHMTTLGTG